MRYSDDLENFVMLAASFMLAMARTKNVRADAWSGKALLYFLSVLSGIFVGFLLEV
jgi:hypothetical protein